MDWCPAEMAEAPSGVCCVAGVKTTTSIPNSTSNLFIQKHAASVIGILSGFDRLRFRGTDVRPQDSEAGLVAS